MTAASENGPAETAHVGKAIRSAVIWNFVTMAFGQVAIAFIFLLLASKIAPEMFGTFALAAVLTDLAFMIGTISAVDAIVQQKDTSPRTLSTVIWTMMGFCIIATVLMMAGANWYANAIGTPQVAPILEALSLTTLLMPFLIGPMAIMRERLDFKGLAVLGMISTLGGSVAALAVAYSPFIEWALVVQRFMTSLVFIIIATPRTRFIPGLNFDVNAARAWVSSTSRIFAGQSVANLGPRVVDLLMGIFYGPVAVGYLRVALKLYELAVSMLVNPFAQLWVVLLTRARDSRETISGIFLQLTKLVSLVALPGFVGLALVSKEIVAVTLNEQYAPVADMLVVLGVLGIFVPLNNSRFAVLTATQRFNSLLQFSIIEMIVTVVSMIALSYFGATAMLGGLGVSNTVLVLFALPVVLSATHTRIRELANSLMPPYAAVFAMALGVLAIEPMLPAYGALPILIIKATIGATIYIGVLGLFFRRSVLDSFKVVAAR